MQIRNEHDGFYQKGELTKHIHKAHKLTQGEMAYRKAIIAAIDNMGDNHLRSSIEEIEKHVKANLPSDIEWNHILFLTTLKAIMEDGAVEISSNKLSLSPDYKQRKVRSIVTKLCQHSQPAPMALVSLRTDDESTLRNDDHLKYKAAKRKVSRQDRENEMETS